MSSETPATTNPRLKEYVRAWGESVANVLQQVTGEPHTWHELSPEVTRTLIESLKQESIAVQFEANQGLSGKQGFLLAKKEALRLARLMLAEPDDGASELSDDHRDALGEFFRQFAGASASALKSLAGGEVGFKWVGLDTISEQAALQAGIQWNSSKLPSLSVVAELGANLVAALNSGSPTAAPTLELPLPSLPPSQVSPSLDPKLELLMDVELDVRLRFGECEMVLHDVLDLSAGSVVELNQYVQDPVELLVGNKLIARGEVVVVDGNYGIRVVEIISPMARIESLRP